MKSIVYAVAVVVLAMPARAQVGHVPAQSPYQDLKYSQELTPVLGYVRTRHDPAGVAPQGAPMIGLRYELHLTGPLALSTEITHSRNSRSVLDPSKPAATRALGTVSSPVTSADLAFALNLTGEKSWHLLVPQVRGGIGLVHSAAQDDSSGFSFGTPLAFVIGGGLKLVPGGRVQFRADITDRIFHLTYPDSYYRLAPDNTAVLDATTPREFYTHHTALTVGVSWLFGR